MDRRQFITWFGVGALANSFPLVLAACTSSTNPTATNSPNLPINQAARTDGFKPVAKIQDLTAQGFLLDKNTFSKPVLVVSDPSSKQLSAVNPTCTHKGCPVNWNVQQKSFICPCHEAKYNPKGEVLTGPATKPLEKFAVKEENGLVLVKVG